MQPVLHENIVHENSCIKGKANFIEQTMLVCDTLSEGLCNGQNI